jgi:hypothetical protein
MKNNVQNIIVVFALILAVICGVIGYNLKKCNTIVPSTIVIHDTSYSSYPVYIDTHSVPTSKPISNKPNIKYAAVTEHDTIYLEKEYPTFTSSDTITPVKGFHVAILDTGNCYGILHRGTKIFGAFPERIIINTVTNTISRPVPLFTLYAGVQGSFSTKWKAVDVGPAISLVLKNKHSLGYGYQLNTGTHSLTLKTKLK